LAFFSNPILTLMFNFLFYRFLLFSFLFQLEGFSCFGQDTQQSKAGILFYNVENLFSPGHNEGKDDMEFTPDGERRWTTNRQRRKEDNISRVMLYAGKWNPPVLVGLCEVEDLEVLKSLVFNTGLNNLSYLVVHYESPDNRGIDVALLYKSDRFKVLHSAPKGVRVGPDRRPTRDILYVKGVLDGMDTLHVMVNHWPSRWGGEVQTAEKRMAASNVLRQLCDSILRNSSDARMVVMGDFNDAPDNESLRNLENCLFNLARNAVGEVPGTIKYRHEWNCFDQMLISQSLLPGNSGCKLILTKKEMDIIAAPFLLEDDPQYPGRRLKRTYRGYSYLGGFSDHLPVYLELVRQDSF
jgi:predicted extracellular nuclease